MPRYDWQCTHCGRVDEVTCSIHEFERLQHMPLSCAECGGESQRYRPAWNTVTVVPPSLYPYYDQAADHVFENRQQKDEYLTAHDLTEVGYTMV